MIVVLILIPVVGFALFIFTYYKTDWKAIDKQNRQFYVDGYHIYYDRKILRRLYPQDDTASETNNE